MKRTFMNQKPKGTCFFCGRSTQLFVHQNCHHPDKKKKPLVLIDSAGAVKKITGGHQ